MPPDGPEQSTSPLVRAYRLIRLFAASALRLRRGRCGVPVRRRPAATADHQALVAPGARYPGGARARARAPARRPSSDCHRVQPRVVAGHLGDPRREPGALRGQVRRPALAADRLAGGALGDDLHRAQQAPRYCPHQSHHRRYPDQRRARGHLPGGHDHGRYAAAPVSRLVVPARAGSRRARGDCRHPLSATRRHRQPGRLLCRRALAARILAADPAPPQHAGRADLRRGDGDLGANAARDRARLRSAHRARPAPARARQEV